MTYGLLHEIGLFAELVEGLPKGGLSGVERDPPVPPPGTKVEREAGFPGEISDGLVEGRILVMQVNALGLQNLSGLNPLLDALGKGFGPPADLGVLVVRRFLQGFKRGRPRDVKLPGRQLPFLKFLAAQLIDELSDVPGIRLPRGCGLRLCGQNSKESEGTRQIAGDDTHE